MLWLARRRLRLLSGLAAVLLPTLLLLANGRAVASTSAPAPATAGLAGDAKAQCLYSASSIGLLGRLESEIGHSVSCVVLFNNHAPDWAAWTDTRWRASPTADDQWDQWKAAAPGRRIIISQAMVPVDAPSDWRQRGARGSYDVYARRLAQNLVAQNLGDSVIRLGWEANDGSDAGSALGTDPSQYGAWAGYWARIVKTMRAVPGAHFLFDWTVNAGWRPVPLAAWYPGDEVVNIVGVDAYDEGVRQPGLSPAAHWQALVSEADGLRAVTAFASSHHKPLSIPEWGLIGNSGTNGGGGDDPTYVRGIASVVRSNRVSYQAYFDRPGEGVIPLDAFPDVLSTYRQSFGPPAASAPS